MKVLPFRRSQPPKALQNVPAPLDHKRWAEAALRVAELADQASPDLIAIIDVFADLEAPATTTQADGRILELACAVLAVLERTELPFSESELAELRLHVRAFCLAACSASGHTTR